MIYVVERGEKEGEKSKVRFESSLLYSIQRVSLLRNGFLHMDVWVNKVIDTYTISSLFTRTNPILFIIIIQCLVCWEKTASIEMSLLPSHLVFFKIKWKRTDPICWHASPTSPSSKIPIVSKGMWF